MSDETNDAAPAEFDREALDRYLAGVLADYSSPSQLERIAGGQSNPTYFLDAGERFVLRKQPPGKLLPSAHAVDREFRVMGALAGTRVPVPEVLHFCEDPTVVGTPFYIMRRVEGRVFHQAALGDCSIDARRGMYLALARTLAALHDVIPGDIGLGDYGRPEGYFERQIARWTKQWQLSATEPDRNIEALIGWLPAHIPAEAATAIAHGDYRMGNVMFAPKGPAIVAVLDWELSTLGHPLADLAHCCIAWHMTPEEYGGVLGLDLAAEGLPGQSEFEDHYYAASGHGLTMDGFHMAFALFRFAVVFAGIAARARAGNAANARAAELGPLARVLARRAADVADRA